MDYVYKYVLETIFISYCAIVAQARQEKVRRDSETSNGRSKRAKTLAIGANYSTNREL